LTFQLSVCHACGVVGCKQCDVGLIYDEQRHCLLNKWILLHIPEDTVAGATGYVKISAALLGPGDDAPVRLTVYVFLDRVNSSLDAANMLSVINVFLI